MIEKIYKKIIQNKKNTLIFIIILTLISSIPTVFFPGVRSGHDTYFHLSRISAITDNIREMNRKKQKKLKELLPREDKMEYERSIKGNNEKLMNIAINATSGYKVMITASVDTTIEELLKIYVHKIKLPERVINNEIVFLFDGQKLDHTSQQEIGTAFKDAAIIIVVDIGEIIGA